MLEIMFCFFKESFFFFNVYSCLRVCVNGEGAEREGDRVSEASSVLTAASPMLGLNSQSVRS